MPLLYSFSILVAMLPMLAFATHFNGLPYTNFLFAFGISCCAGFFMPNRRAFIPSFSLPYMALSIFICSQWNTSVLVGSSLVASIVFTISLFAISTIKNGKITRLATSQLSSSYYFVLAGIILSFAVCMVMGNIFFQQDLHSSIHTIFFVSMIICLFTSIFFIALPRHWKCISFIIGVLFGTWISSRFGILDSPLGSFFTVALYNIPIEFGVTHLHFPALSSTNVALLWKDFALTFNSFPAFTMPWPIMPEWQLEPSCYTALAGFFLALEYTLHAQTSAILRHLSTQNFYQSKAIWVQVFIAFMGSLFTGIPLALSAEGNALYRLIHNREAQSILLAGILALLLAFIGREQSLLFQIPMPIFGVMALVFGTYLFFAAAALFQHRYTIWDITLKVLMVSTLYFFSSYFMIPDIPFPPLWLCLGLGFLANSISNSFSK